MGKKFPRKNLQLSHLIITVYNASQYKGIILGKQSLSHRVQKRYCSCIYSRANAHVSLHSNFAHLSDRDFNLLEFSDREIINEILN